MPKRFRETNGCPKIQRESERRVNHIQPWTTFLSLWSRLSAWGSPLVWWLQFAAAPPPKWRRGPARFQTLHMWAELENAIIWRWIVRQWAKMKMLLWCYCVSIVQRTMRKRLTKQKLSEDMWEVFSMFQYSRHSELIRSPEIEPFKRVKIVQHSAVCSKAQEAPESGRSIWKKMPCLELDHAWSRSPNGIQGYQGFRLFFLNSKTI